MPRRAVSPGYANSWALLIGIDILADQWLPPLTNAVSDTQALADVLKEEFDFNHVVTLFDEAATAKAIRRALMDTMMKEVGPDDRVIVYFAGYGFAQETGLGPVGILVPYDTEPNSTATTIGMDELTRLACRLKAKHVLVLVDTQHTGYAIIPPFDPAVARQWESTYALNQELIGTLDLFTPPLKAQLKRFLTRPERLIMTASSRYTDEQVAEKGIDGHTYFTGYLLRALLGAAGSPGGILRGFHVATYVQDRVMQESRLFEQTPQFAALMGTGGDLVFRVQLRESIFLSYRRTDSEGYAGRIYDRLVSKFGEDDVFMDVGTIDPGADFVREINDTVGSCAVLLTLIGPNWLNVVDSEGNRRLDNQNDYVRLEIVSALKRSVHVIPVLVQGARMPHADDLPDDLKELARLNAVNLRHDRFGDDVEDLIETIASILQPAQEAKNFR